MSGAVTRREFSTITSGTERKRGFVGILPCRSVPFWSNIPLSPSPFHTFSPSISSIIYLKKDLMIYLLTSYGILLFRVFIKYARAEKEK